MIKHYIDNFSLKYLLIEYKGFYYENKKEKVIVKNFSLFVLSLLVFLFNCTMIITVSQTNYVKSASMTNNYYEYSKEFLNDLLVDDVEIYLDETKDLINQNERGYNESDLVLVEQARGIKELKPYGKIEFTTSVFLIQKDDEKCVYFVRTDTSFIPGYALRRLGDKAYKNYISTSSRQITTIKAMERLYYGYSVVGETPEVEQYGPKNYNSKPEINPGMNALTVELGKKYGWTFDYDFTSTRRAVHEFSSGEIVTMANGGNFDGQFTVSHEFWYRVDMFLGVTTYIKFSPSFTVYAFDGQI